MTHFMIDIETLSTAKNATILTIAARTFGLKPFKTGSEIYLKLDLNDYVNYNTFHRDPNTEAWWQNQKESVRKEAFSGETKIKDAMKELARFINKQRRPYYVWSHGKEFDLPILEHAFQTVKIKTPWDFWNTRDTRTVYHLAGVSLKDIVCDNAHNALSDVDRQLETLKISLEKLNIR